jgi:hypothetical protein
MFSAISAFFKTIMNLRLNIQLLLCFFLMTSFPNLGNAQNKVKILCTGNSITTSFDDKASFRYYLWQELAAAGFAWNDRSQEDESIVDFVGQMCGVDENEGGSTCGWPLYDSTAWDWDYAAWVAKTTMEARYLLRQQLPEHTPDIACIHLGTNDIVYGSDLDSSKIYMKAIIDTLRSFNPSVITMLCQIIPMRNREADVAAYNQKMIEIAQEHATPESPIYLVDQFTGFDTDWTFDGIHPKDTGEQFMGKRYAEALLPVLDSVTQSRLFMVDPANDTIVSPNALFPVYMEAQTFNGFDSVMLFSNNDCIGKAEKVYDSLYRYEYMPFDTGFHYLKAAGIISGRDTVWTEMRCIAFLEGLSPEEISIMEIQGDNFLSPFENRAIRTCGIVTAVSSDSTGFWIQDATGDGNAYSSDGIFVENSLAAYIPHSGDSIALSGYIEEYSCGIQAQPLTRIRFPFDFQVYANDVGLPAPITIRNVTQSIVWKKRSFESAEGMLVSVPNGRVVAPTQKDGTFGLIARGNRAPGSGHYYPYYVVIAEKRVGDTIDYNPEVLPVGMKTLDTGYTVCPYDTIYSISGVVDYENGNYILQPFPSSISIGKRPCEPHSPVSYRRWPTGNFRITSFNTGGLFDAANDPGVNDMVVSEEDLAIKLSKLRRAVIDELEIPSILALQGVEKANLLHSLAKSINDEISANYKALHLETDDFRGLDCGILYDSTQSHLYDLQLLQDTFVDSAFSSEIPYANGKPLAAVFEINGSYLLLIVMELKTNDGDEPLYGIGPQTRASEWYRNMQAQAIRASVDTVFSNYPNAYVILAGELNDYPFQEPYEIGKHPLAVLKGDSTTSQHIFISSYDLIQDSHRFTTINEGVAVMSNHILISQAWLKYATGTDVLHFNTQFPATMAADSTNAFKCSPHDAVEMRFK